MLDRETLEALKENSAAMDRVAKAQWLMYMATQKSMEDRTPSSMVFGSYNFNPTNSATQLVAWRQVLPRNTRRKAVRFSALNQTLFLATSDNSITIDNLVLFQKNGWNGAIPVMVNTFTAGSILRLDTTDAIYVASLTGAGSMVEQNAIISWAEEIYSSVSAIPMHENDNNIARPGVVEHLTAGAMHLDGDVRATFTREGVR